MSLNRLAIFLKNCIVVSKVRNKEGDIILPLFINAEVYPQNTYNKLPYLSIISINRN